MKWSFLPPDESEYDQSSISKHQFAENRRFRWTCYTSWNTFSKMQIVDTIQDKQALVSSRKNYKEKIGEGTHRLKGT